MNERFPQYTTEYISGVMSLRKPQKTSLQILERALDALPMQKDADLDDSLQKMHALFPTCTDFERQFPSLTFALATGVGKTRLMGAFIAYLYTQHDIRNFFVVAPNTTIYEKLKKDLGDGDSEKYVFRGLSCFAVNKPVIIKDDEYRDKNLRLDDSDVHIYIYNIDKFNKESTEMRKRHERMEGSFYKVLSRLPDLALIMDESHHYRAEQGAKALNDLHPLLGLELTATPVVTKGGKQEKFKNVVYEYPLSKAIEDGYTRTPFAVTRSDIRAFNFGEEALDKLMLKDGIACHERAKRSLTDYAVNNSTPEKPLRTVKPFMLVVCKDTDHAAWVESYVKSDEFRGGAYRNKTIVVHSKQKGAETEANMKLLLDVEKPENPVEIVIHVNMLKEGWDVNNLYTIVPLRTAASKVLREQMVGRGLRLPYGERTGDERVDAVMLTAHDKFDEILKEAEKGDSIFKAGNVIDGKELDEPEEFTCTQLTFRETPDEDLTEAYAQTGLTESEENDVLLMTARRYLQEETADHIANEGAASPPRKERKQEIAQAVGQRLAEDKDLGAIFRENDQPLLAWLYEETEPVYRQTRDKFIPIPQIRVSDAGAEEYVFADFDLDLSEFTHAPLRNDLLQQSLTDMSDRQRIKGDAIDFDGYEPKRAIVRELRKEPEIDYERCSSLLFKLITQVCDHYEGRYGENGLRNIVMMYKRDIAKKIYRQMMLEGHFRCENGLLQEEVSDVRTHNYRQNYRYRCEAGLYDEFTGDIRSVLFKDLKRGVFSTAKFDSKEGELTLARVLERDDDVLKWLRPAPNEFNITYSGGRRYEPDFVAETADCCYLIEVKAEKEMEDPDVLAKKERGVQYCEVATRWCRANGYKPWKYLFIPASKILPNSTFRSLVSQFQILQ